MVSLELLAGLADSIGNLHQRQRTRTVPSIPDHLEKVFSLVTFALQGSVGRNLYNHYLNQTFCKRFHSPVTLQARGFSQVRFTDVQSSRSQIQSILPNLWVTP